jgi:uncharacterized protein
MDQASVQRRFDAALDGFIEELRRDRAIVAAILCGSLSHDAVWAKSDIDLVLVTIDDRLVEASKDRTIPIYAEGVNIHAWLMTRTEFRKAVEGSARNSFVHSFLAKGRLLYTHDPTVADLCAGLAGIGRRDTEVQLLVTRGDLDYTALWILYAATPLAQIEVMSRGLLADREVIPQALGLNPEFFETVYTGLLNTKKTPARVQAALDAVDGYIARRTPVLFGPVLEYLTDAGEARSASEIEAHFERHLGASGVTTACEYLADQGLIGKAAIPRKLTKRSSLDVQEIAFFPISGAAAMARRSEG